MNDKGDSQHISRSFEAIRETFQSSRLLPPRRKPVLRRTYPSYDEAHCMTGQELSDFCSIGEDILLCDTSEATGTPKPFAGFGSYRQVHGGSTVDGRTSSKLKTGISSEAPAKLGRDYSYVKDITAQSDASTLSFEDLALTNPPEPPKPIDITRKTSASKVQSGRLSQLRKQKSWSKDIDHDEAWERKKDLHSSGSLTMSYDLTKGRKIGRSVSDCCSMIASNPHQGTSRRRSLTDDDLDELRGCIDLGFDFSNQADPKMWDTFPALELCYAISQQLKDEQSRSSPVSIFDHDALDASSASVTNASAPSAARSLMISSPGDHPQVVKDRLRHWAQAVAFTVRQSLI